MPLSSNATTVPRNLDVENTLMRRTQGFDYYVPRGRPAFSLQTLLEHGLIVGICGGERIGAFQFIPQRVTNKPCCCFQSTVQKDRTGNRFKHIGQQSILLPAATLLFATSET